MKSVMAVLCLVLVSVSLALGGTPKKYGKALTVKETTKMSEILAHPETYNGKRVRVEGPVVDVCKKRGCWIRLGSDKEFESLQFKVEDGVIVFPMDAKGKTAVAEGIVAVTTYSVDDQIKQGKHEAEEHGTTFDPASVKGPKTVVRILGEGAEIR